MNEELLWWQKGIIYQIYPRSFMDSNGDGVGDLQGIISKLDYIQDLGVTAIWLSPIYPSPMKDFGYDVSDYCDIHPLFGSIQDFDQFVKEVHRRNIKLILDFVPNHTSDQHPWFQESRLSKKSSKRDWYIWKDPGPDGGAPNNWLSNFGGSAWTLDLKTGQYYYHAFLSEQPDLNWRNQEVQEAMLNNMRFWLDKGVDGFRLDVIWHIIKDDQYRDNPEWPEYEPHLSPHRKVVDVYSSDQPEVHSIIEKMRHVLDIYDQRMMVGEIYLPIERLMTYYGSEGKGTHLPFNFHLMHVAWTPREVSSVVENYEASLPKHGWPNWVLGNHDNHRLASRFGDAQIRIAGMLLLTLRGTPTMYYGDELGMRDVHIPTDDIQDPYEKNVPGMGHGRDPERTPMQWNAEEYAGFSTEKPWLPLSSDYGEQNVEFQSNQANSTLNFYRKMIKVRQSNPALLDGSYRKVCANDNYFAYLRINKTQTFLVVLNFCQYGGEFKYPKMEGKIILSTFLDRENENVSEQISVRANEGIVIEIKV